MKGVNKKYIQEFRCTPNGARKYMWMLVGVTTDMVAIIGILVLINNVYRLINMFYFYILLFLLLVVILLGGEMIGLYFGALEQYIYDKKKRNHDE